MDERATASIDAQSPSSWVVRFAPLIVADGTILDVACGRGRHARWFAARGHRVTGIDRDVGVLDVCGATETIACDLEDGSPWPLGDRRFAAVVVTRYLHRPLFPHLLDALAPGGVMLYETFAVGNAQFGRPGNPDFLLQSGELLAVCGAVPGLQIVAFEDGRVDLPRPGSVQRICVVRDDGRQAENIRHPL